MRTIILLVLACTILLPITPVRAGEIVASRDTIFLVNGTWVPAENLKPGDVFVTADGKRAVVTDVGSVSMENASCYGLVTESAREDHANAQVSAAAHGNWLTRWWQWVRAFFS